MQSGKYKILRNGGLIYGKEKKQGEIWFVQCALGKDYPMGRRF